MRQRAVLPGRRWRGDHRQRGEPVRHDRVALHRDGVRRAAAALAAAEAAPAAPAAPAEAEAGADAGRVGGQGGGGGGGGSGGGPERLRGHGRKRVEFRAVLLGAVPADAEEHAVLHDAAGDATQRELPEHLRRTRLGRGGTRKTADGQEYKGAPARGETVLVFMQ